MAAAEHLRGGRRSGIGADEGEDLRRKGHPLHRRGAGDAHQADRPAGRQLDARIHGALALPRRQEHAGRRQGAIHRDGRQPALQPYGQSRTLGPAKGVGAGTRPNPARTAAAESRTRGDRRGNRSAEGQLFGGQPQCGDAAGGHQGAQRILRLPDAGAQTPDARTGRADESAGRTRTAGACRPGPAGRQTIGADERGGGADRGSGDLQGSLHADLLCPQRRVVPLLRHPLGRIVGARGDLLQGQYFPEHPGGVEERRADALFVEPHDRKHRPAAENLVARLRNDAAPLRLRPDGQHRVGNGIRRTARTAHRRQRPRSGHHRRDFDRRAGTLFGHRARRSFEPAIQLHRLQVPNPRHRGQHDERRDAGG